MDSYLPRQISQSDCEISSSGGKNPGSPSSRYRIRCGFIFFHSGKRIKKYSDLLPNSPDACGQKPRDLYVVSFYRSSSPGNSYGLLAFMNVNKEIVILIKLYFTYTIRAVRGYPRNVL